MKPQSDYRIKIDKDLLREFFLSDKVTPEQFNEVKKVIVVVMIKHFSNYQTNEDLIHYAWLAVLSRKSSYDPSKDPYNYIYTICRNEIGNNISKLTREVNAEDINSVRSCLLESCDTELPDEVNKFKDQLLGLSDFNLLRISKKDALNLILFIKLHEKQKLFKLPTFFESNSYEVRVLYKLLEEIFSE